MNFNKTTEYSLRILSFMSLDEKKLCSAELLHEKLKIPKKYLQRLLTDLARNGFIKSERGRNGGFAFARSTDQIFLSEIISSAEGFNWSPKCLFGFGECAFNNKCVMHDKWALAHENFVKMLSTTRLSDLKKPQI
jgi:Rrf2 family transcriptional regulator, iron-sulfur cluster assembly transcription factor